MNTTYENLNDNQIVENVLTRYALTQVELADMLLIGQPRISEVLSGRKFLRPKVRKKLVEMLVEKDNSEG